MWENSSCTEEQLVFYNTSIGFESALPRWEALLTILVLTLIVVMTIVGNILVVLSVFTHKPLRIVQNFFIVSLAVADLTVSILVMPVSVAYFIIGKWIFGIHICKTWLTFDVLCCTASILNLCAIALDRFWAITDPINYAQKRTLKRVLLLIAGVWLLSLIISSPPLIGWNDWPDNEEDLLNEPCQLTQRQGYIIYSSLGSFYIPLVIMTIVYVQIFIATRRRLRERARASKINAISTKAQVANESDKKGGKKEDRESVSSETNHNEQPSPSDSTIKGKDKKQQKNKKKKKNSEKENIYLKPVMVHEDSYTDNPYNSPTTARYSSNLIATENVTCTTPIIASTQSHTNKSQKGSTVKNKVVKDPACSTKKSGGLHQFIEEKQRISLSKERRAARTLGIIMGVFVVCWLPFFLMYVIIPFCADCCPSRRVITYITWLGYVNSALNPIIYTIFNLDFRKAFKKLLLMQA